MSRGDIVWADMGSTAGRRPVVVLTRDAAIGALAHLTCAPLTRTRRGIRSEVDVARRRGLGGDSVISCDNVVSVPKSAIDTRRIGSLTLVERISLDHALRYALDIAY